MNKKSESIGHYKKDGDRIIIYDRQWNRKGYLENSGNDWERGSIFDSNNRKPGYIEKKGNQISIYDKQWDRKGYAIVDEQDQRYFNREWERIDPDELPRQLKK